MYSVYSLNIKFTKLLKHYLITILSFSSFSSFLFFWILSVILHNSINNIFFLRLKSVSVLTQHLVFPITQFKMFYLIGLNLSCFNSNFLLVPDYLFASIFSLHREEISISPKIPLLNNLHSQNIGLCFKKLTHCQIKHSLCVRLWVCHFSFTLPVCYNIFLPNNEFTKFNKFQQIYTI